MIYRFSVDKFGWSNSVFHVGIQFMFGNAFINSLIFLSYNKKARDWWKKKIWKVDTKVHDISNYGMRTVLE